MKLTQSKFFCFVCGILLALFGSLALMSLLMPERAYAQRINDLATLKVEIPSRMVDGREAVREAASAAPSALARQQIIDTLGEPSYQKNKAVIEEKIVKQMTKYIPFVNAGEPLKQRDGTWKVPVEMKFSGQTLRKMLLENGLTGSTAGAASILPLIAFTDRTRAISLRWWSGDVSSPEQKPLGVLETILHAKLADEIQKQNLVFTRPPEAEVALPESMKVDRPGPNDIAAIGNYFKSAMIAKGDVRVTAATAGAATVVAKIQVVQVSAPDRVIAEVVREFTTDPHAATIDVGLKTKSNIEFAALAKDLSLQVQQAWQRGTVGTNFISLAVRGALTPVQQSSFKTEFAKNVREVRDVKERLFERDQVTYEIDYSGGADQFANRLRGLRIAGFDVKVPATGVGSRTLTIDVRPLAQ